MLRRAGSACNFYIRNTEIPVLVVEVVFSSPLLAFPLSPRDDNKNNDAHTPRSSAPIDTLGAPKSVQHIARVHDNQQMTIVKIGTASWERSNS
jgi:hypothetical protein